MSIFATLFDSGFLRLRLYTRKRARRLQFQFRIVNVSRKYKREKTHFVISKELFQKFRVFTNDMPEFKENERKFNE